MRTKLLVVAAVIAAFAMMRTPGSAQVPAGVGKGVTKGKAEAMPVPRVNGKPDLSGVWQGGNLSLALGEATASALTGKGAAKGGPGAAAQGAEGLPYKPEVLPAVKQYRDRRGIDDPMSRCLMVGVPRITSMPMPFQITQMDKQVIFLYEAFHAFRIVPTDGQPHHDDAEPSFMGDSVAHWDGDTLVVDVTSFNDKTWLGAVGSLHSEKLHVVEKYTRVAYDTINYQVTIEDPEVFTRPFTQQSSIRLRPGDRVREYECGENNEDIVRFEGLLKKPEVFTK